MTIVELSDILIIRMVQIIQTTSFIRQRGQLTVPEVIRKDTSWVSDGSPVSISRAKDDEIIIRPYSPKKTLSWEQLYKQMKRVRSFKGKGEHGSLSELIVKDRETRR